MPPSVARFAVEVSGPNVRPCAAAARLRSSWTTPGCDAGARAVGVDRQDRVQVAGQVEHEPRAPTVCPARLVPAPRGRTGTPSRAATATAAATSSASRGKATAEGSIAYMLASLE